MPTTWATNTATGHIESPREEGRGDRGEGRWCRALLVFHLDASWWLTDQDGSGRTRWTSLVTVVCF